VRFPGLILVASLMVAVGAAHAENRGWIHPAGETPANAGGDGAASPPAVGTSADDAAWRILKDTGTAEQLRRFIAESPDGPQRREAEERLKALEPADAAPPAVELAAPVQGKPPGGMHEPVDESSGAPKPAQATQAAVLYEEEPANSTGRQFPGTAVWRTGQERAPGRDKPKVAIRGDVEIPERKMSVHLSLLRNGDMQFPASHTVEIVFTLSPDFPHGGVKNIPGILMKAGETTRGVALSGVAVKVTDNFFMVGLSSAEADVKRNVQLLKERSWFDIPVVYDDGKRALIAIEKGLSGQRAFAEAFAAWEQEDRAAGVRTP
jgi:hypothetical protein